MEVARAFSNRSGNLSSKKILLSLCWYASAFVDIKILERDHIIDADRWSVTLISYSYAIINKNLKKKILTFWDKESLQRKCVKAFKMFQISLTFHSSIREFVIGN